MQVYHRDCTRLPMWFRRLFNLGPTTVPMRLVREGIDMHTRTYRCEGCRTSIHIDMDWESKNILALKEMRGRLERW